MGNLILQLTNYSNRFKNKRVYKFFHTVLETLGFVKFFHRYRTNLNEVKFEINILDANITMIDRSPKFYYYYLFLKGDGYEPALTKKIHALITETKNPVFIDIGAHIGYYSMLSASWNKGTNPTYAIEPNPDFFATLNDNISINKLNKKVKLFQLALSNKTGKAKMTGWDSRVMDEDDLGDVNTITFDQFCENERIKPDILKIDVHGAEGKILEGMEKTLKQVSHIFCETHHKMMGYSVEDIVQMMIAGGLKVYEFTEHRSTAGGKIIPINEVTLSEHDDRIIYGIRE